MLMRNSCRSWTKLGIAPAALLVAACAQLQPHPATSQTDARSTEATARPVPSADDEQSENPWLVLGVALERRVAVDRDGDGLGRRLVDLVAMEEYHRQTAEKYRVGREKNASSVDPRILAQMQVAERQHREAAARWMMQADAVAAQVRASGEDAIGVDGARLDSEAFCGVWAESSATDDRALVGRFCEGLHQAATVRFAELDELPSACVAPALADGGSAVIAMRCQSAPAPAGTPTFVNKAEGKVVHMGRPKKGGGRFGSRSPSPSDQPARQRASSSRRSERSTMTGIRRAAGKRGSLIAGFGCLSLFRVSMAAPAGRWPVSLASRAFGMPHDAAWDPPSPLAVARSEDALLAPAPNECEMMKLFEVTEKDIQVLDGGAASKDPIGVGRTLYGWVASERRQGEDPEEARLLR